jgi:hypothetical protein
MHGIGLESRDRENTLDLIVDVRRDILAEING